MPGLSLAQFFSPLDQHAAEFAQSPLLTPEPRNFVLYGPEHSGKTSLLFHLAYSLASQNANVLLLGSRERLENSPPCLGPGLDPSNPGWSRVQMKYIEDDVALLRYASLLHISTTRQDMTPTVLLIDDLDRLVAVGPHAGGSSVGRAAEEGKPKSRDAAMSKLLATLCDSLEHLYHALGRPTLLGATMSTASAFETPRWMHFVPRWLPLALRCSPCPQQQHGGGGSAHGSSQDRFRLAAVDPWSHAAEGPVPVSWEAEYSLSQGLVLETVHARMVSLLPPRR